MNKTLTCSFKQWAKMFTLIKHRNPKLIVCYNFAKKMPRIFFSFLSRKVLLTYTHDKPSFLFLLKNLIYYFTIGRSKNFYGRQWERKENPICFYELLRTSYSLMPLESFISIPGWNIGCKRDTILYKCQRSSSGDVFPLSRWGAPWGKNSRYGDFIIGRSFL